MHPCRYRPMTPGNPQLRATAGVRAGSTARRRPPGCWVRRRSFRGLQRRMSRQTDVDPRAVVVGDRAYRLDRAPERFDQSARHRQTEPDAGRAAPIAATTEELVEYAVDITCGYARPFIFNAENDVLAIGTDFHGDQRTGWRMFDGILDHIHQ